MEGSEGACGAENVGMDVRFYCAVALALRVCGALLRPRLSGPRDKKKWTGRVARRNCSRKHLSAVARMWITRGEEEWSRGWPPMNPEPRRPCTHSSTRDMMAA